jgi:hypothetical protein
MNERIKELAVQARNEWLPTTNFPDKYTGMHPELMEKFAELIIKECVSVIEKNENYRPGITEIVDEYTTGVQIGLASAIGDIEKYFDIEA